MGISVNSSCSGASLIRAWESVRLMDPLARLPTKYPILYVAIAVFLPDTKRVALSWLPGGPGTGVIIPAQSSMDRPVIPEAKTKRQGAAGTPWPKRHALFGGPHRPFGPAFLLEGPAPTP